MNKRILTVGVLLALGSVVGCYGAPPESDNRAVGAITGFTFDTRGIERHPAAEIPAERLTLAAFQDAPVTRSLLRTSERFETVSTLGRRINQNSASWHLEKDDTSGQILAARGTPEGAPVRIDEARLQADSTALLTGWGVGSGETGRVVQRRLMLRGEEAGVESRAGTVFRHKTFFFRGINGVPIEGHRAVVTWGRDASMRRVFLNWPPIASEGHRLRTGLSTQEITRRAAEALRASGETSGDVRLRWKYVPTLLSTGEVALTLGVSARLAGSTDTDGTTEEAREVDVDVSAE